MLIPKSFKFKKRHKGRVYGYSAKNNRLIFGLFGLQSKGVIRVKNIQIESTRRTIVKIVKNMSKKYKLKQKHIHIRPNKVKKKIGKLWIKFFPDIPVSKKPTEVRMGKGKGNVEYWVSRIRFNQILFELDGISNSIAYTAFIQGGNKLPLKNKYIKI